MQTRQVAKTIDMERFLKYYNIFDMIKMSECMNPDTCPNGNCPGCRNGKVWCQDPRCAPYCQYCGIPSNFDYNVNAVIIVILICILAALFIVWFVYGPSFFQTHNDHDRAQVLVPEEMKVT